VGQDNSGAQEVPKGPKKEQNHGGLNARGLLSDMLPVAIKAAAVVAAGGATGGTGYIAYLAISAAAAFLRRRKGRKAAVVADEFCDATRDDEEARQLLQLSMLEGRNPLHDAIIGRFAFDELDRVIDGSDEWPDARDYAKKLKAILENKFNEMAPLSVKEKRNE
jgi:hypothetical protein